MLQKLDELKLGRKFGIMDLSCKLAVLNSLFVFNRKIVRARNRHTAASYFSKYFYVPSSDGQKTNFFNSFLCKNTVIYLKKNTIFFLGGSV